MTILNERLLLAASALAFAWSSKIDPRIAAALFVGDAILAQIRDTVTPTKGPSTTGETSTGGTFTCAITTYDTARKFEFSPVSTGAAVLNVLATVAMVTGSPALIAPFAAYLIIGAFAARLAQVFCDEVVPSLYLGI